MRSGDDELVQKLSERVAEEIESLPRDGKDHEIRIKIKGSHNNVNLGSQTFEVKPGKELPPEGSNRERVCPQCEKPTWRFTQLCMHCDYDHHRHDQIEAEEQDALRKKRNELRLLVVCVASIAIAFGGFSLKIHFPAEYQGWVAGFSALAGFIAFMILQAVR